MCVGFSAQTQERKAATLFQKLARDSGDPWLCHRLPIGVSKGPEVGDLHTSPLMMFESPSCDLLGSQFPLCEMKIMIHPLSGSSIDRESPLGAGPVSL